MKTKIQPNITKNNNLKKYTKKENVTQSDIQMYVKEKKNDSHNIMNCINNVKQCMICFDNKKEIKKRDKKYWIENEFKGNLDTINNISTCYYCNNIICYPCTFEMRTAFNKHIKCNKIYNIKNFYLEAINHLLCPLCKKLQKFKEEDKYSENNIFNNQFMNLIKNECSNLESSLEKNYKCRECGEKKKTKQCIPSCDNCGISNMEHI